MSRLAWLAIPGLLLGFAGLAKPGSVCDPEDAGLALPEGLCAQRLGSGLGPVRHLAVLPNGDVIAAVRADPGVALLRDADGDGEAEQVHRFGPPRGQGIAWSGTHLYLSTHDRVVRWPWKPGQLRPTDDPERVVHDFPAQREHAAKAIALDGQGSLFVTIGAPSNACQVSNRTARSPGLDPCPQRDAHAGIWRFSAEQLEQAAASGRRHASGMRHTLALAFDPGGEHLYAAIHGRDQLGQLWGFSNERNAELPAEEFVRVEAGDDFGWPYCYWDGLEQRRVLAPEYEGDEADPKRCQELGSPRIAFPAHWAPMALVFHPGAQLGAEYQGGAFLAFHGSWNRAPLPQEGYRVVFVPFASGGPVGTYRTFARSSREPNGIRPSGLAVGPDGALFIADDANETIWRVWRPAPGAAVTSPAHEVTHR